MISDELVKLESSSFTWKMGGTRWIGTYDFDIFVQSFYNTIASRNTVITVVSAETGERKAFRVSSHPGVYTRHLTYTALFMSDVFLYFNIANNIETCA